MKKLRLSLNYEKETYIYTKRWGIFFFFFFSCDFAVDGTNSVEQTWNRNPSILTVDIVEYSWRNRGASLLLTFLTCASSVNQCLSKLFSTSLWILNMFWMFEYVLNTFDSRILPWRNLGDCKHIPRSVKCIQLSNII